MSNVTVFVGLDYHQAFVQMCVMDASGAVLSNRKCANSAAALVEAVRLHAVGASVAAAVESCCGAPDLAEELVAAGWQVSLAHATYVHKRGSPANLLAGSLSNRMLHPQRRSPAVVISHSVALVDSL